MNNIVNMSKDMIVLVVDDDEVILNLAEAVLEWMGFNVILSKTGKSMLYELDRRIPDIILLDIHLPDMSGIEIAEILKADPRYKNIPVLAITSDTEKETVEKACALNVFDFIEKPVNIPLMVNRIEKTVKHFKLGSRLLEKEIKLNELQHVACMGYWEFDSKTDRFKCSDKLYEMLDVDKQDQFDFYNFLSKIYHEDTDRVSEELRDAIDNETSFAIEHRMYDGSGSELIVINQGIVRCDDDQKRSYKILSTVTDISDRKNSPIDIDYAELHDALTGLANRRFFYKKVEELMESSDENEKLMAVLFVGIDRFKHINDSFGHSVGDDLLVQISERISKIEDCFVARFSGDVFSVVVTNMSTIEKAEMLANSIQEDMVKMFEVQDHDIYITVSIGFSIYPLCHGGKDQLLNHAEAAMDYSKKYGGNKIFCFDKKKTSLHRRRLFIETDLRKAIEKDQLELHYQPQVTVQNRRLIGMEALIRWNHPEHGMINPDDFIPIAEDTGLILPIGQWVLEEAARQASDWVEKGYGLLRVGVNLSPLQFDNEKLVQNVEEVIHNSGLLPCSLDIEVTESSAMRNMDQTIKMLNMFKELGIQTSIDDFGTGYSSLSHLKEMPIHTLKVDRAFVKDIKAGGKNGELAQMIISMCHTLGLNVIAEGVENEDHMQFLLRNKCIEAQGYLFSPPVSAEKFEELLQTEYNSNFDEDGVDSRVVLFG